MYIYTTQYSVHLYNTIHTISKQCTLYNTHHLNTAHIFTTQYTSFQHIAHLYNTIHTIWTHCTSTQHNTQHHNTQIYNKVHNFTTHRMPSQPRTNLYNAIHTITTQQNAQHYSTVHTNTTQHKRTESAKLINWQSQRKQKALHESTDLAVPSVGQRAVVGEEETSVGELLPCGVAHCIVVVRVAQPFIWNWDTNSPLCIK